MYILYADSNIGTSAAISNTSELTDIGGYACYQREGNYWTMIDGEECLVIDVQSATKINDDVSADVKSSTSNYPSFWGNKTTVSLSTKLSYTDDIDLSRGDYYSPIFELPDTYGSYEGLEITTNHIVKHTYDILVVTQDPFTTSSWNVESTSITFDVFSRTRVIIVNKGFPVTKVGIVFLASSSGRDDFELSFTQFEKKNEYS